MRPRTVFGVVLLGFWLAAGPATAIPVDVTTPTPPVQLSPGDTTTLELLLTPGPMGVKGYLFFFEVSDITDVVVESCAVPLGAGDSPVCPAGGLELNFGKLDFDPAKDLPFEFASVTLAIPAAASLGAKFFLTEASTLTTGDFQDVGLARRVIAEVVPEPGTLSLLVIGLLSFGASSNRRHGRG